MDSGKSISDNTIYKKNELTEEFDITKFARFIIRNKIFISSITGFSIFISGIYGYLKTKGLARSIPNSNSERRKRF